MKTLGERIKSARINRGMTQEELGKLVGVQRAAINKYETGVVVNLKRSMIANLAQALDVDPTWLLGMTEAGDPVPANLFVPKFDTVPIIGTIACGEPILAQENVEGLATKSDHIEADFALWCKGDSMTPRFNNGDLVFIRQQSDVDNGQIAAVLIENEATLKHVYKQPDRLTLIAENPSFPPLIYTDPVELQQIRILGLVTGYQRAVNQ
jgi:repressor LexA